MKKFLTFFLMLFLVTPLFYSPSSPVSNVKKAEASTTPVVGFFSPEALLTAAANVNLNIRQPDPRNGDLMIATIAIRPAASTVNTPSGWTLLDSRTGTDGGAEGADTGSVGTYVFYKVADGTEGTADQTFTENGTTSVWNGSIMQIRSSTGTYDLTAGGYSKDGDATNWNGTLDTDIGLTVGDLVIIGGATNGDLSAHSAQAIAATGISSISTVREHGEFPSTTGNDIEQTISTGMIWAGTNSTTPTITYTQSVASSGVVYAVRVRQGSGTNRTDTFVRSSSAQVAGTTSVIVPYPDHEIGDRLIMFVGNRYDTATPSTPANWTLIANNYTGGAGANGADAGTARISAYYRDVTSLLTGTQTVTVTSGNTAIGQIFAIHKDDIVTWTMDSDGGGDSSAGTAWSVTGSGIDLGSADGGDIVLVGSSINTDIYTYTAHAMSASGITFGDVTQSSEFRSATGNDMTLMAATARVSGGSASNVAPTFTATASGSTASAPAGASIFIKILGTAPTTTLGDGTDGGNSTIAPGASATEIDRFSLSTNTGTDTVTGMTVTLAPAGAFNNLATVGVYTTGDVLKCSSSSWGGDLTVELTSCDISVTTTSTEYVVKITPLSHAAMPAVPGASYATTATVTAITATNSTAGTDTDSATITVDNASPAGVTSSTATAGNTLVNLAWTNPADSDFTTSGTVVVLRRATSAVADVPVEGTTYTVGNTIGTATVACVVTGSPPATTCSDTSLTNGTVYHYKIFTQDSRGNYDAGVVPTGSPATPSASGSTISGIVYTDDAASTAFDCSATSLTLRVAVNGTLSGTPVACTLNTGAYSITGVTGLSSGAVVSVFVDTATSANQSATITRAVGSGDLTGLQVIQGRVTVRDEDGTSITNANLGQYDADDNANIPFTSNAGALSVTAGHKLLVWTGKTFTPGGTVTTAASATSGNIDGDILIQSTATLAMGTNALSVGGDFTNSGTITYGTQTTTFTATGTGFAIEDGTDNFHHVIFNGSGGGWSNSSALTLAGDLTMTAGTLSGTNNITVNGGDVTDNGTINLTGGIFTINTGGSLGGSSLWTFYDLTIGAAGNATTTATGVGGFLVSNNLVIDTGDTFNLDTNDPALDVNGDVTIDGTLVASSSATTTFGGNYTNSGTFTNSNGTITFDATSTGKTLSGTLSGFSNVTFNGSGGGWSNSSALTLAGDLTMTAGTLSGTNNITVNGGDVTDNGTINLTGGIFTINTGGSLGGSSLWTFYDLTIGAAGNATTTATGVGGFLVSNNLVIDTGDTFNLDTNDPTLDVNGDVTIAASGTLIVSATATTTFGGNYTNSGTFTNSNGTITFDATSTGKILSGTLWTASGTFNNVIFNGSGGGWTNTSQMNVNDLTMTAGTLSGTSTVSVLGGDVTGNGTINLTGGIFNVETTGNFGGDTNWNFDTLRFLSGGTTTAIGSGTITASSIFRITSANTLNAGSKTYILSGSGTPFVVEGTFSAQTSTIQYTSTSATNITATTYYNLSLIPAGTVTHTLGTAGSQTIRTDGTFLIGNGTNVVTATGATWNPALDIRGDMTIAANAVLTRGSGLLTFKKGSTQTLTDNTTGSGQNLGTVQISVNTTPTTLNLATKAQMTSLTIDASQIFSHNGANTLTLSGTGTPFVISGTYTPSTGTLEYTGTSATNITATTYYNLGVKPGAAAITHTAAAGTLTISNNLAVGDGTNTGTFNLDTNDPTLDVNGDVTIAASGTLIVSATATTTFGGNYTNSGTFTHSSGTITFDATSTGKILSGTLSSFNNLIFNGSGGGWSNSSALTLAGDLIVTAGTLSGTNNITINGGDATGNGTINLTGGTFTMNTVGNFGGDTAWTLSGLTIGAAGNAVTTATSTGGITVSGVLTIDTGDTLNAGSKAWTLSGSGTPLIATGTFTASTSIFNYTGTSATNIAAATYNNLGIGITANSTAVTYTLLGTTVVGGTLTVGAGSDTGIHTLDLAAFVYTTTGATTIANSGTLLSSSATGTKTFTGNVTVNSGGIWNETAAAVVAYAGNLQNDGTFTASSGVHTFSGTAKTISGANAIAIPSLTISGTTQNDGTLTVSTALAGASTLTNGATGTLNIGFATAPAITTLTATASGNIVNYTAVAPNCKVVTYDNLNFTGSGAVVCATLATVNSNLTFSPSSSMTYTAPAAGLTIGGNLSIGTNMAFTSTSGNLALSGNLTNDGTFTHNSGTLTVAPTTSTTIDGTNNITFNNFTVSAAGGAGKSLIFKSGNTYTFAGAFNVAGQSGSILGVSSTTPSSKWNTTFNSTAVANYISIKDSGCSGGNDITASSTNVNLGNNDSCWRFISRGGGGGGVEASAAPAGQVGGGSAGGGAGGVEAPVNPSPPASGGTPSGGGGDSGFLYGKSNLASVITPNVGSGGLTILSFALLLFLKLLI